MLIQFSALLILLVFRAHRNFQITLHTMILSTHLSYFILISMLIIMHMRLHFNSTLIMIGTNFVGIKVKVLKLQSQSLQKQNKSCRKSQGHETPKLKSLNCQTPKSNTLYFP
jgi:hypothetical protein